MRIFAKIIPIPDMDHHFYEKIWRESIMRYRGVARGFDYPTLAMLSKGTFFFYYKFFEKLRKR